MKPMLPLKIFLTTVFVFSLVLHQTCCIPIARSLGCGDASETLSVERKFYCCVHFKLNCDTDVTAPTPSSAQPIRVSENTDFVAQSQRQHENEDGNDEKESVTKLLRVKNLGQSCSSKWVRCGTGLECRLGFCVRDRSSEHFRRLVAVGKEVENAEHMAEREMSKSDNGMEGNTDTVIKMKNDEVIIKGQSLDYDPMEVVHGSAIELDNRETQIGKRKIGRVDKAAVHGDEEDEVTANIADYLASKGKPLNKAEWHTMRRLISGTLDERSQRDEEVDQVDAVESAAKLQKEREQRKVEGQGIQCDA